MTASLAPTPIFKAFDNNGAPLAGGKVFTYIAGTTTKQATYTDSTQGTPNTNPVILNARGEAPIWLDISKSYKIVLSPSTDTDPPTASIWAVDNIQGAAIGNIIPALDNTYTLGSPTFSWANVYVGSNHAPVLDTSTGIVSYYPRTAAEVSASVTPTSYSYPQGYVLRYGVNTTPGTTDMTSAINQAIAVAQAGVDSRWVYFSPGRYLTTGITLSGTLQSIKFFGNGAFLDTTTNAPIFDVNTAEDLVWDGLYFFGNAGAISNNQCGIKLENTSRSRIYDCHFENLTCGLWDNNALTGLMTAGVQIPSQISGCTIKNCFNGILTQDDGVSHYGEYLRISDNTINDCLNCGIIDHAGNTAICNNTITGNGLGILIDSTAPNSNGDHGLIVGNTVNHNFRANLYILNTLRCQIVTGNNFWACLSGNLGAGVLASSFGAYIDTCSSIIFTNNVLGRNKTNFGSRAIQFCVIAHNEFLTDPVNTVDQWVDSTAYGSPNFNCYGPNNFTGTFTSGGVVGNPNGDFIVGAAGAAAFTNGWVNLGGGFAPAKYWKDEQNVVHLQGIIQTGTLATAAFTLPATMRPTDGTRNFPVFSNGAFGWCQITTAGSVIPAAGSNLSFSLDGISFRAGAVTA